MGFDAEIYANKIVKWKDFDNEGTCVYGDVNYSFCKFVNPDFFNDDCYGTFKLERKYLEEKLNELLLIQTTIGEIINADENEILNINDKVEIASIIKEILKSDAKIFIVRWDY